MEIINVLIEIFQQDDKKFIFALYREMLNRQPRQGELDYYLNKISTGTSKMTVLEDILKSHEIFLLYNRPLQASVIDKRNTVANTLRRIFNLDSIDFVKELYRQLLCREADRNGFKDFVSFLIREKTMGGKFTVFKNILMSEEALNLLLSSHNEKDVPNLQGQEALKLIESCETAEENVISVNGELSLLKEDIVGVENNMVSIIIPTYNDVEMVKNCVQSLRKTISGTPYEIIVIDDGSNTQVQQSLEAWAKENQVLLILKKGNKGFSSTVNTGIKASRGQYILLLNNDVILFEMDWLKKMLSVMNGESDIGIVGAKLLYLDRTIQHAGVFPTGDLFFDHRFRFLPSDYQPAQVIEDIHAVTGALFLINRKLIEDIGVFSEEYFMAYEDIDYCYRAKQKGWRVVYCGTACAIHLEGKTRGNFSTMNQFYLNVEFDSKNKFWNKWKGYAPGINICGYPRIENGIGEACRSAANAIEKVEIPFGIINMADGRDHSWAHKEKNEAVFKVNLIYANADTMQSVYNQLGKKSFDGRYNIGYWHWELPNFPNKWSRSFSFVQEVWVPSNFVQNSLSKKSPVPIIRIPHAIEVNVPQNLGRSYFQLPNDKLLFLTMYDSFSFKERKNPEAVIEAFQHAFGKKHDSPGLVIKVNNSAHKPNEIIELKKRIWDTPNVYIIDKTLTRNEVNALINCTDCFVSLHRSEGFGLVLAEAMYLKKPVIGTNWSGNIDFMNETNSCPVNYSLVKVGNDYGPYNRQENWAEPDIEHASYYFKKIVNNNIWRRRIGLKGKETIIQNYSPQVVGQMIKKRLLHLKLI